MRAGREEQNFADWLKQLGDGTLPAVDDIGDDVIQLPDECVTTEPLTDVIFGQSLTADSAQFYVSRAILCPTNDECVRLNNELVERLPGDAATYFSVDSVLCDDPSEADSFPLEFLNSLTPSGMPRTQWRRQEFFSRGARSLSPPFPFLPPFPFPSSTLSLPASPLPLPSLSLPSKRGGRQVERPSPSLPSPTFPSPALLSPPFPSP